MQILKTEQYINEKLDIKPITKTAISNMEHKPDVDEDTMYIIEDYDLLWNPITKCYDCDRSINDCSDLVSDGNFIFKFGNVKGDFYCNNCRLKSLEGAPQKVGGYFDCSSNELKTLEGSPKIVDGGFDCSYNDLETLKGAPKKVGGDFYCFCNKLTSLEGSPDIIDGEFACENNNLTSLDGAPKCVGENFHCEDNPDLVLPKKKPSWVKGKIIS